MDDLDKVIDKLDMIKNTHPNLYSFWKNYLIIKKEAIEGEITKCNNIINTISCIEDIELSNIYLLSIITQNK